MADPVLEERGGAAHPDPEMGGGELDLQKIFSALQASVWSVTVNILKGGLIRGGGPQQSTPHIYVRTFSF